jgi:hypothetical protein
VSNNPLRPYDPYGRSDPKEVRGTLERGVRSFLIRLRRAGFTFVGLVAALAVYMVAFGGVGFFSFLFALFAIMMLSFLVMGLPVRDRTRREHAVERPVVDGGAAVRLDRITLQTEQWLIQRSRALPYQAGPALDRIVGRLRDLEPSLATVPADSQIGGEAQRLIAQHLPSLVDTYGAAANGARAAREHQRSACGKPGDRRRPTRRSVRAGGGGAAHGFRDRASLHRDPLQEDGRLSLDRPS